MTGRLRLPCWRFKRPALHGRAARSDERRRLGRRKARIPNIQRYGVERWLEIYADHAHNHADQIKRARASAR